MRFALFAIALPAMAQAQQPADRVRRALDAMGGQAAVQQLGTVSYESHSVAFNLGQSETAESPPRAGVSIGRYVIDWPGMRRLIVLENRGVTGVTTRQRQVVAGGIGMTQVGTGAAQPAAPGLVANTERAMRLSPERLLLAMLDGSVRLAPAGTRVFRGETLDGVRLFGRDTVTAWFERMAGRLMGVETLTDDPILGDRSTVTWYTRWEPVGMVRLPRQVDIMVNDRLQTHFVFGPITTLASAADSFAIPDSIAARAQRTAPPAGITVNLVQLSPTVWRAEGGTHFTLVVDQGDQLVLVEAPQSGARMQAVLDTVATRFPGKRIGTVVNTHHHWDHSGGLRPVIARGIPIVTSPRNDAFVRGMAAARKTVAPDSLSRRPRPPVLRLVAGDSLVLGTGDTRVVVYPLPTIHSADVLAAWVPGSGILFTSDVLSPGATLAPAGSAEMVTFARARGLTPERFAGGHGTVVPWGDVERAAGR